MRVEGAAFYPYVLIGMVVLFVAMMFLPCPVLAHRPTDPPHQLYRMGDFKLESGEVIQDMVVSYVTHGQLNQKKSNVILMITAIGGNHHRIDFLIGPGKALDTTKYYVVCVDAISNGLTTSPSNSKTQPRMKFPRFTIRDMVHSQHRLLRDHLGIDRVVTIIGRMGEVGRMLGHSRYAGSIPAADLKERIRAFQAGSLEHRAIAAPEAT